MESKPRIDGQPFYDWRNGIGPVTFFKTHYGANPPYPDELHRYDPALWRAVVTRCSRNKMEGKHPAAISELMPLRPIAEQMHRALQPNRPYTLREGPGPTTRDPS